MSSVALYDEEREEVIFKTDDVSFTMTKEDYDFTKQMLKDGINIEDLSPIIRPCDIIGFLQETNPEAQENVAETERTMAKRNTFSKEQLTIMSVGMLIFMALIGLGALYILVSASTGDAGAASAAASGVSVG